MAYLNSVRDHSVGNLSGYFHRSIEHFSTDYTAKSFVGLACDMHCLPDGPEIFKTIGEAYKP